MNSQLNGDLRVKTSGAENSRYKGPEVGRGQGNIRKANVTVA